MIRIGSIQGVENFSSMKELVPVKDDLKVGYGIGFNCGLEQASSVKLRFNREQLCQALARGYCHELNSYKVLDHYLIDAIADAIIASGSELLEVVND